MNGMRSLSLSCVLCVLCEAAPGAQLLLDRVLARVGTEAITQTDVQSLVEFGLIEAKSATEPAAVRQAID